MNKTDRSDECFNNSSNVYNIFTKKVMPEQFATKFLNLENIGKEKYHKFLAINKQVTVNINKQLVNVKEERKLMSRFVIASRSRSDIDLPNYFATYDFSVVSRSLFTMDGFLHQINDKATIARAIRKTLS